MYLEHFALSDAPFQFTASPTALFMSPTHREGLAALEWGLLHEPSGLTLLIGESGLGKTTLACAALAKHCGEVLIAYLANPRLPFEQLLADILSQIGIRGARSGKAAMLRAFTTATADARVAIVVDEAQLLGDDVLEELRLLSNIEHYRRKAAQIILIGQVELLHRLMQPRWRHLNERIGARTVLTPLSELESRDYLRHRVEACGGDLSHLFSRQALTYIVQNGGGIPRRLNILAHNALLSAYCAKAHQVSLRLAKASAADSGLADISASTSPRLRLSALKPVLTLPLLALVLFIAAYLGWGSSAARRLRASVPSAIKQAKTAAHLADPAAVKARVFTPPVHPPAAEQPAPPAQAAPKIQSSQHVNVRPTEMKVVKTDPPKQATKPPLSDTDANRRRHVVVARGDTLSSIAVHYFGSPGMVPEIVRINPQISDPQIIVPGEVVYLPSPADLANNEGNE